MNLDIIARLVQILRDAPELGAIEVRRGLFGAWSAVRVFADKTPEQAQMFFDDLLKITTGRSFENVRDHAIIRYAIFSLRGACEFCSRNDFLLSRSFSVGCTSPVMSVARSYATERLPAGA